MHYVTFSLASASISTETIIFQIVWEPRLTKDEFLVIQMYKLRFSRFERPHNKFQWLYVVGIRHKAHPDNLHIEMLVITWYAVNAANLDSVELAYPAQKS